MDRPYAVKHRHQLHGVIIGAVEGGPNAAAAGFPGTGECARIVPTCASGKDNGRSEVGADRDLRRLVGIEFPERLALRMLKSVC
jgi:hypothetical protein